MTKEEKLELYNKAKDAYYNGEEIMPDLEFDELEKELGLENKSYIGSTSPNYTIKHPFIMGSLSKVQVKADKNGYIDWNAIVENISKYVGSNEVIITPKYDGCSFEYYWNNGEVTISSRGDGNYGKDLSKHIAKQCQCLNSINGSSICNQYVIRGEVLIKKKLFAEKYSNFANPRAFVSGMLNRKYEDIEDKTILDDLSIVVYDVRLFDTEWHDVDWTMLEGTTAFDLLPDRFEIVNKIHDEDGFRVLYDMFSAYRSNESEFALDGFVVKPTEKNRVLNLTKERPDDCVAIKFLPEINETVVTGIQWQLGKTGEYTPVVLFEPVMLDGKVVSKASGSNYGNLLDKGICVGSEIRISLAGDIIPFIYEVTKPVECNFEFDDNMYVDGCHLMKKLNIVEQMEVDFLASCRSLNIPGIGDKIAQQIFDCLDYKLDHIFYVNEDHIRYALDSGEGKTYKNVVKSIEEAKKNKNLTDVIASMNIRDCGPKCADQCARYLITGNGDFSGLSGVGYNWCIAARDKNAVPDNESYKIYTRLLSILRNKDDSDKDHEFDRYAHDYEDNNEGKIKVILTGSPVEFKTKKDFLNAHPEYTETTKFNECQILFTGDMNSTSSKMLKARKLGIEIRQY